MSRTEARRIRPAGPVGASAHRSKDSASTPERAVAEWWNALEHWGSRRDWLGADPYEGLNARYSRALSLGGRPLARRLLIQAVKTSPIDLRPALRIRPRYNAKASALIASGYARAGSRPEHSDALEGLLQRMSALDLEPGADESAWGYHFDFQSRVFFYPRTAPNTVATTFVMHALLDAWDATGQEHWLTLARRAARFLIRRMLVTRTGTGTYFRYVVGHDDLIHNANGLALSVVLRTAQASDEPLPDGAMAALDCLLKAQRPDGSWPYGRAEALSWIDHYHTGYVLESLEYARRAGAPCAPALSQGLEFYDGHLFCEDGLTPRWTTERDLPLDTHCIAQAIETHAAMAAWRPDSRERAVAIARNGVGLAGLPDGSYVFERRRWWTSRVPMVRWTNGPMFRALGSLLRVLRRAEG